MPETPTAPAAAPVRSLTQRLARMAISPANVEAMLEDARKCLRDADRAYQQAHEERTAAEGTANKTKAQQAAAESAVREAAAQRMTAARELTMARRQAEHAQAMLEDAHARVAAAQARRDRPRRARAAVADLPGQCLRPDPAAAQTPGELIDALRQFRTWAGNPSYRDMAQRAGRVGASTMCKVLRCGELPRRFEVIDAIIEGCAGSEEDRQRFAAAWRRLTLGARDVSPPPRLQAVPAPRPATHHDAAARRTSRQGHVGIRDTHRRIPEAGEAAARR